MAKRKVVQAATSEASAKPGKKLNLNQERFAREYVRHGNARLAYHTAYPEAGVRTCEVNGSNMLRKAEIAEFIEFLKDEDRLSVNFSRQDALRIFTEIASSKTSSDKNRIEAARELWDKLRLGEESRKGNWFDGLDRLAQLVRETKK